MRTCAAKVQLPSECRISHSSQSTYFDAVALYTHPRLQEAMTCAKTNGIGIRPSLTALHQVRSNESPGRKPRAMCSFTIGGLPAGRMKRKRDVSRDSKMGKGSISPNDTIGKPGSLFASWFPTFRTRPSPKPSDAAPSAWTSSSSRSGRGSSTGHDYATSTNPPILHRKETFLPPGHPLVAKFARLTRQEEKHGLLDETASIGTRAGWQRRLAERGFQIR